MSARSQAVRVFAALMVLIGGYGLSCWYFAAVPPASVWRNPATDFLVWSPMGFAAALLESWFVWEVFFRKFQAREYPVLSAAVFASVMVFNGLVIG